MARLKITLRVRSFRRRFFDQFEEITFLRFRLFFFFFQSFSRIFPTFFHDECEKTIRK